MLGRSWLNACYRGHHPLPSLGVVGAENTDLRRELGRQGEQLALDHLGRLGFYTLARNHRTRWGEIDLIVADERTIAFVEVKTRRVGAGHPFDALGPVKRRQVRRMAVAWLAETIDRPRTRDLRFDAIGVTIDAAGRLVALEHLEGAF
jgi:putative endonuclease